MSDGAEVADVEMGPNGTKWDRHFSPKGTSFPA
jgi:hypothetical protein